MKSYLEPRPGSNTLPYWFCSFNWRMIFRHQNVAARWSHCYWDFIASLWAKLGNAMYIHIQTVTNLQWFDLRFFLILWWCENDMYSVATILQILNLDIFLATCVMITVSYDARQWQLPASHVITRVHNQYSHTTYT